MDELINTHGFDLDAEAVLDPTIAPDGNPVDLGAEPRAIFLSGVTGFIGAYLLRELLDGTVADVYTLVRADSHEHAMERIRTNLETYHLWNKTLESRIIPVVGDLKLPLFGLTEAAFAELANTVDVIYHCGSKLSYIAPYEFLKSANVGGTHEALRLATQVRTKPLHYVSSIGILLDYQTPSGGEEDAELDPYMCPPIGYFQSKYVAEKLVRTARDRGVPVTVQRIGLIVGDSTTGISNADDFVARLIIGSILTGYAPGVATNMDMTPVDWVTKAMIYLARQPDSAGKVFHLLNPQPIHWSDVFDLVNEAGYPVTKLPFADWVSALEAHADPETNPLSPLLPFFQINFARRMMGVSDEAYLALGTEATQRALESAGFTCAAIDSRYMQLYLAQFARLGRLNGRIPHGMFV